MVGDCEKDPTQLNKMYLIDFGISQRYLDDQGNHVPFKSDVPFKGNIIFSSKNTFAQKSLSRRDDIISLIYFLVFCVNSNISWLDNSRPVSAQFDQIGKFKINTSAKDFCSEYTPFLAPLLRYAYKLGYTEQPDYGRMRFMMQSILIDKKYVPDQQFDWSLNQDQIY